MKLRSASIKPDSQLQNPAQPELVEGPSFNGDLTASGLCFDKLSMSGFGSD
jgi:hypothetical protein